MNLQRFGGVGLVVVMFLFLNSGCGSIVPKRSVDGNRFESTYPNLTVDVSDEFEYLGNVKNRDVAENFDGVSIDRFNDNYIFADTEGHIIKRYLSVEYLRIGTYFSIDKINKEPYMFEAGLTDHAGKKFDYYSTVVFPSSKGYISRFIADKGYRMPCGLFSEHMKVMGPNGNTLVKLQYYERLEGGRSACMNWLKPDELNDDQRAILDQFNQRFKSSHEMKFH